MSAQPSPSQMTAYQRIHQFLVDEEASGPYSAEEIATLMDMPYGTVSGQLTGMVQRREVFVVADHPRRYRAGNKPDRARRGGSRRRTHLTIPTASREPLSAIQDAWRSVLGLDLSDQDIALALMLADRIRARTEG